MICFNFKHTQSEKKSEIKIIIFMNKIRATAKQRPQHTITIQQHLFDDIFLQQNRRASTLIYFQMYARAHFQTMMPQAIYPETK